MTKKYVLITGIAGFIGFHMAKALQAQNFEIVGLDNFNPYYPTSLKRARQNELQKNGIKIIEGDLCDRNLLMRLFEEYPFTHMLHLAAQAGVRYARENPDAYLKSNLEGFLSVLETLRQHPHVKLVYASSSSVYGTNEKIPFSENDRTDHPANLYAATKKANELMAYSYHHLYKIPMIGLRYFTVYGPWGRPDMAYYHFTTSILKKEPIRIFNQGKMARDFTYIDDAVAGTMAALMLEADFEVYNIGNNHPEPLMKLIELLEKELGVQAIKKFEAASPGEVATTFADISQSIEKLKFSPKTSLEEGIPRFLAWYQDYNQGVKIT